METHVSSTTADVPEPQEVVGSHGNVELVIVVEKLDEEQPQEPNLNPQTVSQDSKALSSQPTKNDASPQSSPSKQLVQETVGKQTEPSKTAPPVIKIQQNKLSTMHTPTKSENPQYKLPEKNDNPSVQVSPAKQLVSQVTVDSTSVKEKPTAEQLVEDNENEDLSVTIERESSNDSQMDMNCDVSEKEHNKSISRELKSLINSAKESKIISECTKLTSKTRKSRTALDTSNSNLNVSVEADSIQGNRRSSSNSQKSNCSEKSEKRSMRSQNPEFVNKVKQFLNSVTGKFQKGVDSDASSASDEDMPDKSKETRTADVAPRTLKTKNLNLEQNSTKSEEKSNKLRSDPYCWRCHWSIDIADEEKTPQPPLKCTVCPRSFHFRCLTGTERTKIANEKNWVCPGCMTVLHAESSETRSSAMKKISLGMLCELLKFALQRMVELNGVEPFTQTVDRAVFPDYDKYVVHPMDLALMRQNVADGLYGSTEAFLGDAHWILHNSIIFNTLQSKLTAAARALVRSCRAEMGEIEACPECYAAAHTRRPTWFTEVCSTPHVLLWAKLKGFPYWPAKAMSVSHAGLVDVRFFGAHDRAWVPARDCFLYSEKDPNNFRTKRQDIIDSMQEAEQHIRNISRKYGKFVYAPYRVQFEPFKLKEQLQLMIPSFEGTVKSPVRDKRPKTPALVKKSRSKGSKEGLNAGIPKAPEQDEGSDIEVSTMDTSKMSDDVDVDKMDEDSPADKSFAASRKRRRSEPKEIPSTPDRPKEKDKRFDSEYIKRRRSMPRDAGAATPDRSKEKNKRAETDTYKRRRSEPREAEVSTPIKEKIKRNATVCKEPKIKKGESLLVSSSKETAAQAKNADEGVEADSDPPRGAAASPAPTPKHNKDAPKISPEKKKRDASPQSTKVSDKVKNNDKDKKATQEPKTTPKNVRSSRSNKSLNNMDPLEVKKNGPDSSSADKIGLIIENNDSSKTYIDSNKDKSEETSMKTTEEEKAVESTDLDTSKYNVNEPSTTSKINEKENVSSTPNKTNDSQKATPNKNNGKDKKQTDAALTDQKTGKDKALDTDTVTKDIPKGKTTTVTSSNITPAKEKSSEDQMPTNNDKSADANVSTNSVEAENSGASTSVDKIIVGKVVDSSDIGKRNSIGKEKLITAKITVKAGGSKIIKAAKGVAAEGEARPPPLVTRAVSKGGALPAISCVRSLAAVEADADSSIFTPTSTDHVRTMKDAMNKLQQLKAGAESPLVGRVGVRAFARIASPPGKPAKSSDVLVEIKAEPMDFEEPEAVEPAPVLGSLRPRPASAAASLREVRINKVVAGPVAAKKAKAPDVRPRAKKTFPQPKKPEDGRSELTSKNSMVYIPIQPPASQAPAPARAAPRAAPAPAPRPPLGPTTVNVSSITPMGPPPPPAAPAAPGVHAVPSVHTVPLITSVNGQWTFSLQPVMSVGGVDSISSPMVNGVAERVPPTPPPPGASPTTPALAPATPPAPAPAPAPVTPARVADAVLGEPPRLRQRPALQSPLAAGTAVGDVPAPSAAGPLSAKLNQNSVKLADFFRTLLEESLEQLDEPEATAAALRLQLEQARWKYQHEVSELRHTQELLLVELRAAMDKEKTRAVAEARRLAHQELDAAVKHAKSKQWCANCYQEAQFYCCWNTAYCDYPCQRAHWAQHFGSCAQQREEAGAEMRPGPARLVDDVPRSAAPAAREPPPRAPIVGSAPPAAAQLTSGEERAAPGAGGGRG